MSNRRAAWCLLLWSVMWVASARAQPIVLDVVPGFDGVCPGEECYPVTVWVQGKRDNPSPTTYRVEVVAPSRAEPSVARKSVTLSGEVVSQAVSFLLCTPGEPFEVTARLVLRGRVIAVSKPVSVTMAQWHPLLVGLGEETSALSHLPEQSLGVVSIEGKLVMADETWLATPAPFLPGAVPDKRQVYVGRVRNSLPPENALAYRGVAAVSLDDRAWDTLTEGQQQALIGYVLSGGLLVVHGVDMNRLQSFTPSGLLPVEPLGLSRVPGWALAPWMPSLSKSLDEVDVVRSRPLGGAKVLLEYRGTPLVVVAQKGLGQVVFLAFDPTQRLFQNEAASPSLWKRVLKLHVDRFIVPTALFPESASSTWGGAMPTVKGAYSEIVQSMVNSVAVRPVPLGWLTAYLGVYVLVLIPLNYVVLRKLDRLHLSWFTLPMLAVLTSFGGYLMASQVQVGSHQLRQWTALYTASGSPQATVESDWVLYSARTQRYRLLAKVDGTILENSSSDLQARRINEIPQDIPGDMRDVPIPLWSARSFHLSGIANLLGSVNVSARRRDDRHLAVTVHNNTPYALQNIHVILPGGYLATGEPCPPGGRVQMSTGWGSKSFVPFVSPTASAPSYPPPQPSETGNSQDWRRQAMASWLSLAGSRLSVAATVGESMADAQTVSRLGQLSRGVVVAEVQGFPPVVEVSPMPPTSDGHVTLLAVAFEVQGGQR